MEVLIQLLMLFIGLNAILKLSFWKGWQVLAFSAFCAGFILWSKQYAILQSKTQIIDYLNDTVALENLAVLVTFEVVICITFCFVAFQNLFKEKRKHWTYLLRAYPSLLLFIVLFYGLTQSIFEFTGIDFNSITYVFATGIFLLLPIATRIIRLLFPEPEFRLEIHFLISLFVAVFRLLTTVNGKVAYVATQNPLNLRAIGIALGLFIGLFLIGYTRNRLKWKRTTPLKNKI